MITYPSERSYTMAEKGTFVASSAGAVSIVKSGLGGYWRIHNAGPAIVNLMNGNTVVEIISPTQTIDQYKGPNDTLAIAVDANSGPVTAGWYDFVVLG